MDQQVVSHYLNKISNSSRTLDFVSNLTHELRSLGETHVSIECEIAFILWEKNLINEAFDKFRFIINKEVENNFSSYDTAYADAVGLATSFLINDYYRESDEEFYDLFVLGYLYLSSHINLYGNVMCDSLENRALLSDRCERYTNLFAMSQLNIVFFIPIPMMISDYYYAGKGFQKYGMQQRMSECFDRASYLHDYLEDMTIGGKDAVEYSLEEMAEFGKKRIEKITSSVHPNDIVDKEKIIEILNK